MVTLETVRKSAAPHTFPRHVLDGCATGLVLFAAQWHGKQDAIWLAEAGIKGTCVDTNADRLAEMATLYPDGWEYLAEDVFEFATMTERMWDVVTIDCPTNLFDRCAGWAAKWCSLARWAVVLGSGGAPELDLPMGWRVSETLQRSSFAGGVYWTVLEPA